MSTDAGPRWMKITTLALRVLLGGVLLYAAYTKLEWDWISFAGAIDGHQVLPYWGVELVARWLPWAELVLGVGLIAGWGLRWFATATTILLLAFFIVLSRSFALGLQVDCGCFGPGDMLSWKTMVRDGLLLGISIAVTIGAFRMHRPGKKVHSEAAEPQARQA